MEKHSFPQFIDDLQSTGRYTFTKSEVQQAAPHLSSTTLSVALHRQLMQGRIAKPKNNFYVIVPLEYRSAGSPPASWFVDPLMAFLKKPYYVGVLSAAALHGAAHQQPYEFQVVSTHPIGTIEVGRNRIRFLVKKQIDLTGITSAKVPTGYMKVSTPEETAFDLLKYIEAAGHLNNATTVLIELAEKLNAEKLVETASRGIELAVVQRVGFLLGKFCNAELAQSLLRWVKEQSPRLVALRPDKPIHGAQKDKNWKIWINEEVDVDI